MTYEIIENSNMIEQFRFPRSGKTRIREKWSRRRRNYKPMRKAIEYGGKLICHPQLAKAIRNLFRV